MAAKIYYQEDCNLSLLEGKKIAEETYARHTFFSDMLQNIGVPKNIAIEDACRIEHVISQETFEAIKKYYQNNKNFVIVVDNLYFRLYNDII